MDLLSRALGLDSGGMLIPSDSWRLPVRQGIALGRDFVVIGDHHDRRGGGAIRGALWVSVAPFITLGSPVRAGGSSLPYPCPHAPWNRAASGKRDSVRPGEPVVPHGPASVGAENLRFTLSGVPAGGPSFHAAPRGGPPVAPRFDGVHCLGHGARPLLLGALRSQRVGPGLTAWVDAARDEAQPVQSPSRHLTATTDATVGWPHAS